MSMRKSPVVILVVVFLGLLPAWGQEIGRFALVQNEVTSLKPGAGAVVRALAGGAVVVDELESSGAAAAAKLTFGEGAVISIGQNTRFKVTREAVAEATGNSTSTVDLLAGKARVFVSRFWSGRPEVRVNTPTAVVGIKGSEVVVEVLAGGTSRITVLTGSASVEPRAGGGSGRTLSAGQQIELAADGTSRETTEPTADQLAALWSATEAGPTAPRALPPQRPTEQAAAGSGGGRAPGAFAVETAAGSSASTTMASPATDIVPDSILPRGGQLQGPVNTIGPPGQSP